MEKTHISARILYFNLKGLKLTLQSCLCFIRRYRFQIWYLICRRSINVRGFVQVIWILRQGAAVSLLVEGLEKVEMVEGGRRLQFCYFCSSPAVLSDFDKDMPGIIGSVS